MHSASATGTGAELGVLLEQLVRLIRQVATAGGLSTAASSALSRLAREGPRRLTDLANAEGVYQPGMTQLVTRMEREGLVRRGPAGTDRRAVLVEATDAGLDLLRRRRAERADVLQQLIDRLERPDRDAIVVALPALTRLVEVRTPELSPPTR